MPFPQTRLRRLRQTPVLRDLVRETRLDPGDFVLPLFVEAGAATAAADRGDARASTGCRSPRPSRRPARPPRSASPRCCCSASRTHKDEEGTRRLRRRGHRPARHARDQGRAPRPARHDRRLPVRVHRATATAGCCAPTARSTTTRRVELIARTAVSQARAGADVVAPSDMMDGRDRRDPRRARRGGPRRHADRRLQREVRVRLLRPVPRGRRLDAGVRRPPRLPDGSGQRRRGAARGAARRRRRAPTW